MKSDRPMLHGANDRPWPEEYKLQRPDVIVFGRSGGCHIVLVMDLDRPYRGLIRVSDQALVDVAKSLGP